VKSKYYKLATAGAIAHMLAGSWQWRQRLQERDPLATSETPKMTGNDGQKWK